MSRMASLQGFGHSAFSSAPFSHLTFLKCTSDHYATLSETFPESLLPGDCLHLLAWHSRLSLLCPPPPRQSYLFSPISHYFPLQVPVISTSLKLNKLDHYLIFSECDLCFPTVILWLKVFSLCGTLLHCPSAF